MIDRLWRGRKLAFEFSWTKVALLASGAFLGLSLLAACEGPVVVEDVPPGSETPEATLAEQLPESSPEVADPLEGPAGEPDHAEMPAEPEVAEEATAEDAGTEADSEAALAPAEARPGDMLTETEAERAEQLALDAASGMLAAATDRDALGAAADLQALAERPSFRVIFTQRHPVKDGEGRQAEVAIYRYDSNDTVLTQVDLESGMVTPLPVEPGYTAPLVPAEISEATRVAMADDEVRAALQGAGLDPDTATANGLLTRAAAGNAESQCSVSRCVRLFFFGPDRVVPEFHVIVDVSALSVVEIAPFAAQEES